MKLNPEFVLRQVAGTWVALPVGQASVDFNGMISLNDSGALLWRTLEQDGEREALADVLVAEYAVDRATALKDADDFLADLAKAGCLMD